MSTDIERLREYFQGKYKACRELAIECAGVGDIDIAVDYDLQAEVYKDVLRVIDMI